MLEEPNEITFPATPTEISKNTRKLVKALLAMDRQQVLGLLTAQINQQDSGPIDTLIVPALDFIGTNWMNGKIALSQVYIASVIIEEMIGVLFPTPPNNQSGSRFAICIFEDYHALGKRITLAMLKAAQIPIIDYDRVNLDELLAKIETDRIEVILCSVLMLRSAMRIRKLKEQIQERNLNTVIVVGGAPFRLNPNLWQIVGADYMGASAHDAVNILRTYSQPIKGETP